SFGVGGPIARGFIADQLFLYLSSIDLPLTSASAQFWLFDPTCSPNPFNPDPCGHADTTGFGITFPTVTPMPDSGHTLLLLSISTVTLFAAHYADRFYSQF